MNNNNNTNDINMADANLAPVNELELVKSALAVLKKTADTLQREHDMAINGGTYDPELAKKVKDARTCYKQYKEESAERFPEEEIFATAKPRVEINQTLRFQEMPCLMAFQEKAREPHGQVYTNVKEFISHLEHYCMGQNLSLDDVHPKCMPMLLGTSYRTYVEEKMQSISKDEVSWTLIKRWLFEFVDTPKQRVKNMKALLNMRPEAGESSDKFITRFWNFHNSIEAENFNLNEVIFVNLMSGMPSTWKQRLNDNVYSSSSSVLKKKSLKEMVDFVSNLELKPEDRKRSADAVGRESFKRNKFWKRDTVASTNSMKSKWTSEGQHTKSTNGVLCGNGCGIRYQPGHNATCPKKSSRDIKVSRAAVRSEPVFDADIDQISNTLQQNMDISDEDDKLE